ncbi:MAG: hypothetical protein KDK97_14010 [Verrucomicrobiales bacterium]|nr:hypothetical protein [Verrucomicrobiales bacterium]MCP5557463.1 hypothetical protein [Verrucomicrobiaceae bacterium]
MRAFSSSFSHVRALLLGILGCIGLGVILRDDAVAATSEITGFYSVAVPQGNSAWVCGLVSGVDFEGAATDVVADSGDGKALVSFEGPGWTVDAFVGWYAEAQSGASAGLAIDILSNTADTLKLDATPAGLTVGTVFVLRRHATLGSLLPDGGGFAPLNDSISLFTSAGLQKSFVFDDVAGTWVDSTLADASDVIIRPGQGFVIYAESPLTLTLGKGTVSYVKVTPTKVMAHAGVPNLMGALNPLSPTSSLGALGVTSSLQAFNDSVVTLTPGTLAQGGTYLSNGAQLIDGQGQSATATPLPAGASVVINVDATKGVTLAPVTTGP